MRSDNDNDNDNNKPKLVPITVEQFKDSFTALCEVANRFMTTSLMHSYFGVLKVLTAEEWARVEWEILHTPLEEVTLPWPGKCLEMGLRVRAAANVEPQRTPEQRARDAAAAKRAVDEIRAKALPSSPPLRGLPAPVRPVRDMPVTAPTAERLEFLERQRRELLANTGTE